MTHPFEDETAEYLVLTNDRGQYSIWPAALHIPPGWLVAHGSAHRQECLRFVDEHWHDLRPLPPHKTPDPDRRG